MPDSRPEEPQSTTFSLGSCHPDGWNRNSKNPSPERIPVTLLNQPQMVGYW